MDTPRVSPEVIRVAREILRYLLENPDAKDTPQGIRRWWLLSSGGAGWRQEEVDDAVSLLEQQDLLQRCEVGPLASIYGLNRTAADRIEQWFSDYIYKGEETNGKRNEPN